MESRCPVLCHFTIWIWLRFKVEIALERDTRLLESWGNKQARRCNPSGRVACSMRATEHKDHYPTKPHTFRRNNKPNGCEICVSFFTQPKIGTFRWFSREESPVVKQANCFTFLANWERTLSRNLMKHLTSIEKWKAVTVLHEPKWMLCSYLFCVVGFEWIRNQWSGTGWVGGADERRWRRRGRAETRRSYTSPPHTSQTSAAARDSLTQCCITTHLTHTHA